MFKNAIAYAVTPGFKLDPEMIRRQAFVECRPSSVRSSGFVAPCDHATGDLLHYVAGYTLICWQTEDKILPSAVIDEATKLRCEEIEERDGFKPGRKQKKEIRELIVQELLPRAFSQKRKTLALFGGDYLIINSATLPRAELLIEELRKAINALPLSNIRTEQSVSGSMAAWIGTSDAPDQLTVDTDCVLISAKESQVKYSNTSLMSKDVRERIADGFTPKRLGMTYADRFSFVLTDQFHLLRLSLLDVITDGAHENAADAAEIFDIDVTIDAGEIIRLLDHLIDELGGLVAPESESKELPLEIASRTVLEAA